MSLKTTIRSFIPERVMLLYHWFWSRLATVRYGYPSRSMYCIGVTGTKGKTSTSYFLYKLLSATGNQVGLISTAVVAIGDVENINRRHMTMPGRAVIQNLLKQMKDAGCRIVIVETTSEGIKYYRHQGVFYDAVLFTNLTPEHLGSHNNSFEEYKASKMRIFKHLMHQPKKGYPKQILANVDDPHGNDFLQYPADIHTPFGITENNIRDIKREGMYTTFSYKNQEMQTLSGVFNIYNALPSILLLEQRGVSLFDIAQALKGVCAIPGRMDYILTDPFSVIVDYAHEPKSIEQALQAAREESEGRVIVIVGGVGGGRDLDSRKGIGKEAGKGADIVIVTDVDPYDEAPEDIARDVSEEVKKEGKVEGVNLFVELDRRSAISLALKKAQKGDVVLITGKGSELTYIKKEGTIEWDERGIVREEIKKVLGV